MVMGIFWDKASRKGVIWGMLTGLGATILYMVLNVPSVKLALGGLPQDGLILGIHPISAGILGVPVGLISIWVCSLIWPDPPYAERKPMMLAENYYPGL